MYVCSLITREFSVCPRDGFTRKNLGRGSWIETRKLAFFVSRGTGRPRAMAGRLGTVMGTGQAIGAHTGAGGQCADAVETCVGADVPTRILHTDAGSGGLGLAKSGTGLPT